MLATCLHSGPGAPEITVAGRGEHSEKPALRFLRGIQVGTAQRFRDPGGRSNRSPFHHANSARLILKSAHGCKSGQARSCLWTIPPQAGAKSRGGRPSPRPRLLVPPSHGNALGSAAWP